MLRDSVVVVAVVRTRPRAIPLAMITMRKSTHGFPFLSYMSMGLRLAALPAAGAPLQICIFGRKVLPRILQIFHSEDHFSVTFLPLKILLKFRWRKEPCFHKSDEKK